MRTRRHPATWKDHRIAVIGGNGGIGEQLCMQLQADGARVFCLDLVTGFDVTDDAVVHRWFDEHPVDTVIYAAGLTASGPLTRDGSIDQLRTLFNVNVAGMVSVAAAASSSLKRTRGRLIVLNSAFSLVTAPGYGAYSTSKAALSMAGTSLRPELAPATVTDCILGGVGTPIFDRAAERAGTEEASNVARRFRQRIARNSPEDAAARILRAGLRRTPRASVGPDAQVGAIAYRIAPSFTQKVLNTLIGDHFQ
ncbi:SDR family NAD(P)-dependent oxidoreductase [Corynebacterium glyciniphilum]|uniref:SDR family NAD(P)-dependent oxidoreductase n=1 Tax=Corynebacterium glyciniphilum TaxID=1404244 RepID=UPI001642E119|nr:SDR family NAD(P)-dependent oxidoreductase [Corynebacterium glyciniphilum]